MSLIHTSNVQCVSCNNNVYLLNITFCLVYICIYIINDILERNDTRVYYLRIMVMIAKLWSNL